MSFRSTTVHVQKHAGFALAAIACSLAVCASAGCAAPELSMNPVPRSFTPRDYARVYDTWTRDADDFSFSLMSTVLHATATFESWEFRWAYVVRYASDHGVSTETRAEMLRASLDDAREHHRFFVTLTGEEYREADLTRNSSAWRVLLVDDQGRQTVPESIERIRRPSPADKVYFPSVSPFRHAFRIVFPAKSEADAPIISPTARHLLLRFTGPRGTVDLKWGLKRGLR